MIKNVESMYQDSSSFVTNPIYVAFECGVIVDHHGCSEDFTRTSAGQITNNFTFFYSMFTKYILLQSSSVLKGAKIWIHSLWQGCVQTQNFILPNSHLFQIILLLPTFSQS